ncbi:cyclase family protein [Deinococcus cellulosilyticus]|uniref:Kynurenine formamidase n=1 Tax=Deinococcus cellulosilyticus (strain DSM 18568 / NBRC 106333 / KACC 11606 / 5516J-15) TaxID=1223518 RepID=A0A511N5R1_DEIC1|nr:cyclase family protein [Deinococcus cellulosilyticus]GEM48195.1 kynurenine formamidase [Deinococcus cellulosilyticus NBRC 106333 = KACC 11606]
MIDLTRKLVHGFPTWPGDTPFAFQPTMQIQHGDTVNVGMFSTTTHLGTHLDAPYHYSDQGLKLGEIPLTTLIGECLVIDARGHRLLPVTLLEGIGQLPERVAFFTGEPEEWSTFPTDFSAFSPELIDHLGHHGVKMLITDAPSVDPLTSKDLPAHQACLRNNIVILEGVNLNGVEFKKYELICLPLNLVDADGAPARAILREL